MYTTEKKLSRSKPQLGDAILTIAMLDLFSAFTTLAIRYLPLNSF
jgi:hypothetical protein